MKLYLKNILFFLCYAFIVSACLIAGYFAYYGISLRDIPAPDLSESYSFNEKMEFLRKRNKNADIVTIGSSMSLNNLDSKTIIKHVGSDSYLNLSSWGMSMKDIFLLLKVQSEIHHPRVLILANSVLDFQMTDKNVKYPVLKLFLHSSDYRQVYYHLKFFNLKYYLTNFKFASQVRSVGNNYEFLGYDQYGAVNLDGNNFQIDEARWKRDYLTASRFLPKEYAYLDSISSFCERSKIKFFFLQSPYRTGLYSKFDETKMKVLKDHVAKVESSVSLHHQTFINANNGVWGDSLFVDGTHFNRQGAKAFTHYCFGNLKGISLN